MKSFARIDSRLISYEGMSEETIITMLTEQGLVPEFIDEATYLSEVAALQAALEAALESK
jgi:hypothetical protein